MSKPILVLTYWSFKEALVQTYTLPFVQMIRNAAPQSPIYLVTFEQKHLQVSDEEWKSICKTYQEQNIFLLRFPYFRFGLGSMFSVMKAVFFLVGFIWLKRIKVIHAFCMPAAGIAWLIKQFTWVKLNIDSYEPHAEAMVENGEWKSSSKSYKILNFLEKRASHAAKNFIATSQGMKNYAENRYNLKIRSFFVKPAGVDIEKFNPLLFNPVELRKKYAIHENAVIGVYIGKFGGIYYNDEIFRLLKAAYIHWSDHFYAIIGTPFSKEDFEHGLQKYGIPKTSIRFLSYVPHHQVPEHLALADFGINPVKPLPTKRYCTSVKDGEYWAMGLPVIIPPNISDDSDLIKENQLGVLWEDPSPEGCLRAIQEMDKLLKSPDLPEIKQRIRQLAIEHRSFDNFYKIYEAIYGAH